jgi:hypothetical protein
VLVVAGTAEAVDRARVAALEAEGAEVTVILTGVPRDPLDPPVEYEQGLQP